MPEPIALWNSARGVWERAEVNILCGHSALFWEIFPTSGTWDATGLYPLPPPGHPIAGSGCSFSPGLLPTPTAREKGGRNSRHGDTTRGDDLPEAIRYLPTPNATDGKGGNVPVGRMREGRPRTAADADLPAAVELLKTPTAQLAVNGGSQHPDKRRAGGHGPTLADQVEHQLLPTPVVTNRAGMTPSPATARGTRGSDLGPAVGSLLLPTPRATDGTKGGPNQRGSSGDLMLPSAVMELLPTPSAADSAGGHLTRGGGRSSEMLLGGIAEQLAAGPWTGDLTDPPSPDGSAP